MTDDSLENKIIRFPDAHGRYDAVVLDRSPQGPFPRSSLEKARKYALEIAAEIYGTPDDEFDYSPSLPKYKK